jgi:hypothetical protein
MIANAKTLPKDGAGRDEEAFHRRLGGYPIIGTPEQIVDG